MAIDAISAGTPGDLTIFCQGSDLETFKVDLGRLGDVGETRGLCNPQESLKGTGLVM